MSAPSVTITPPYSELYEGERVELVCTARGNPAPTVYWRRADGRALPPTAVDTTNTLVIEAVTENDAGEYRCVTTNS